MKTALILSTLAVLSQASLRAEETRYSPINPALLYWQAAALLPTLNEEQAAELREMAAGKKPVDAATLKAVGVDSAAALLRRAAASTAPCNWGLLKEDGPATVMPHLSKIRELANLALVKAEGSLAENHLAEGLDWLLTAHRIARHSGAGETLISFLVQSAIETTVLDAAARHCLGWDEATRRGYAEQLKTLPPLRSSQESYRGELVLTEWFERINELPEPQRTEKLKEVFGMAGSEEKEKFSALMVPETLRQELAAVREFHTRTEAAFGKPWNEGKPELDAIDKDLQQSGFTLAKMALPASAAFYEKTFVIATRRTMLDAALEHGAPLDEARAASYRDAFEGKPLRLEKSGDGELSLVAAEPHPKGKEIRLKLGK
jgi:hypothetical protein